MCRNTDTLAPLAVVLEKHLPDYGKPQACKMINQHKLPTYGQQQSEITMLAEEFFKNRRKLGIDAQLGMVGGTLMQKSALREAIMMLLHKQAGIVFGQSVVIKPVQTIEPITMVDQPLAAVFA